MIDRTNYMISLCMSGAPAERYPTMLSLMSENIVSPELSRDLSFIINYPEGYDTQKNM